MRSFLSFVFLGIFPIEALPPPILSSLGGDIKIIEEKVMQLISCSCALYL